MPAGRFPLDPNFVDILRSFVDGDVRFLVVGAYALAFHGHPRGTGGLDLWIDAHPDNARRASAALARFGAPLHQLTPEDLSDPGVVFQIGIAPVRIDILTSLSGLSFDEAWPSRTEALQEGVTFPILGREALLRNKRATGRPKDLLDAELLGKDMRR